MKKRPQIEAQAQRNMIMYLKNVDGFRLDYFKGMSYDDISPIFEAKFNSNITFLPKSKEQLEEEENRAIQSINKTPAQKAAKKRRLNKEVEDLKQHLEIVPDEDDDVYTKATPLARKVPVVDYEIIHLNNKPYYKIIRADGTHQLYPNNFSDDYLLTTLGAMFERPDGKAQVWKNQRTIHGQAKVKSWKLLESCSVHIITFTTTQLILLVERRYPLSRFTLKQMLNAVRLRVEEHSEMSLELLSLELEDSDADSLPIQAGKKKKQRVSQSEKPSCHSELRMQGKPRVPLSQKIPRRAAYASAGVLVSYQTLGPTTYQCLHCHANMWYEERSNKAKRAVNPTFSICCQEAPRLKNEDIILVEIPFQAKDPEGYKVVTEFMLHGPCGKDAKYAPCNIKEKYSKHFLKAFNEETIVDADGYPIYRRRDNKSSATKGKFKYDNKYVALTTDTFC
nr:hypothetical protein [Tanacetum cinerariifolium]